MSLHSCKCLPVSAVVTNISQHLLTLALLVTALPLGELHSPRTPQDKIHHRRAQNCVPVVRNRALRNQMESYGISVYAAQLRQETPTAERRRSQQSEDAHSIQNDLSIDLVAIMNDSSGLPLGGLQYLPTKTSPCVSRQGSAPRTPRRGLATAAAAFG